jgi:hypothetical protein
MKLRNMIIAAGISAAAIVGAANGQGGITTDDGRLKAVEITNTADSSGLKKDSGLKVAGRLKKDDSGLKLTSGLKKDDSGLKIADENEIGL